MLMDVGLADADELHQSRANCEVSGDWNRSGLLDSVPLHARHFPVIGPGPGAGRGKGAGQIGEGDCFNGSRS
jgi:hypothetical protein